MDQQQFLRFARRWGVAAVVLALVAAIGAYAFTRYAVAKRYTAWTTMEVQLGLVGQQNTVDPYSNEAFAQTEAQVAQQGPNVIAAVSRAISSTRIRLSPSEQVVVENSVACHATPLTALFTCSVSAHAPVFAAAVANQLSQVFMQNEQQAEQQRYQAVLRRIIGEEHAAQAVNDQTRYNTLVGLETNIRLAAAQSAAIVRVVAPASVPSGPSYPHPTTNALLALFAAFFLVLGAGYVANRMDDSIHADEQLKDLTGLPVLGAIPSISQISDQRLSPESLVVARGQLSPSAEAFRVVRGGIQFARVDEPVRRLLVTSTMQGEGKSTFASNIACAFAETGKSVILVDLDLRRPSLSNLVEHSMFGLTNLLVDRTGDPEPYLLPGPIRGLRILPSGPLPPSPAEMISSMRMAEMLDRLQAMADVIVLDTPPIFAAADAAIAGGLCDGAVLVVRPDKVKRRALKRAIETIQSVGVNILGIVVNNVPRAESSYYTYGYYTYQPEMQSDASGPVALR